MRTAIKCHCRVPCAVMKSWTRDNPGRRFMSCKFRHCDFWQWLDVDQSEWQRNAINQVMLDKQLLASEKNLLKSENDHLKENNEKLKAENSLLRSKIMDLESDVFFPAYENSGPSLLRKAFYALIVVIVVLFFMYVNVV
ncbi:hypothetical protein RND81_08G044900 [Saponaria officinalis]|uniref:Zinc finger GRF-type domain-containing protein n=1 Tax=Saponaria officinalis TaxID=3572 RepID=A0AAW1J3G8_SAPOF